MSRLSYMFKTDEELDELVRNKDLRNSFKLELKTSNRRLRYGAYLSDIVLSSGFGYLLSAQISSYITNNGYNWDVNSYHGRLLTVVCIGTAFIGSLSRFVISEITSCNKKIISGLEDVDALESIVERKNKAGYN